MGEYSECTECGEVSKALVAECSCLSQKNADALKKMVGKTVESVEFIKDWDGTFIKLKMKDSGVCDLFFSKYTCEVKVSFE